MTRLQDRTKFRKQTFASNYQNFGDSNDFLLNIRSNEEPPVSLDISYIQMSTAISAVFGLVLIYFLIVGSCYILVGHFSFIFVSILYCVIEFIKYVSCYNSIPTFSCISFEDICNFFGSCAGLLISTYVITVLFGADLADNIGATFIFSYHLTSFVFIPLYLHAGEKFFNLILLEEKPKTSIEYCDLITAISVLACAWAGAFVIPLDWDREWQQWPIPCIMGSIFGFTAINIFLLFCTLFKKNYLPEMFNFFRINKISS